MKTVLMYNNSRADTTGLYVNRALKDLGADYVYINPLNQPIPAGADVYLLIDDGVDYWLEGDGKNFIYWAIDTHFTPEQCKKKAFGATATFTAQKNGISVLPDSKWLPLGCDLEIHGNTAMEKKYDVCFIGHVYPSMEKRAKHLDTLFRGIPNFYYGQLFFNDMAKVYGQSKIVFNCSLNNDINMRVFEAMASGSMLLTDKIHDNGMDEIGLIDGENCAIYGNEDEMMDKAKYYIKNESARAMIEAKAREWAEKNTYRKRVEDIFKIIGESK